MVAIVIPQFQQVLDQIQWNPQTVQDLQQAVINGPQITICSANDSVSSLLQNIIESTCIYIFTLLETTIWSSAHINLGFVRLGGFAYFTDFIIIMYLKLPCYQLMCIPYQELASELSTGMNAQFHPHSY